MITINNNLDSLMDLLGIKRSNNLSSNNNHHEKNEKIFDQLFFMGTLQTTLKSEALEG